MPEEIDAGEVKIKQLGTFDLDEVISTIRKWLKKRKYGYFEKKHKYKPDEREIEIEVDKKVNEYVKNDMEVSILATDLKEVEVIKDGKKEKKLHGKIMISVKGKMYLDWMKRFDKGDFHKTVRTLLHKHIIGYKIGGWKDEIEGDVVALGRKIRDVLEMV